MNNTTLEDERLKKTLVVIMTVVAVLTLATTAELQNALAATSMTYGSYVAHHHTRICGFKAFTQGKCFPRI